VEILRADGLRRYFGGLRAVNGVNLSVQRGERRALIGPNGAGKTTLFSLIGGELRPSEGKVLLKNQDVTRLPPHERATRGLGRTFQRNNLFAGLTVFENVRLAVQRRMAISAAVLRPASAYSQVSQRSQQVLEQVGLGTAGQRAVRVLSYGEQRQLEIAVALAGQPELLLLDEPTAGMSPAETEAMVNLIHALPRDLTLMIVEHDMDVVFALCDRITVLQYGQVLAEGEPAEVRENAAVREAYLGAAG
jgi:branched-chain amino acid transport system ATP-binding protein